MEKFTLPFLRKQQQVEASAKQRGKGRNGVGDPVHQRPGNRRPPHLSSFCSQHYRMWVVMATWRKGITSGRVWRQQKLDIQIRFHRPWTKGVVKKTFQKAVLWNSIDIFDIIYSRIWKGLRKEPQIEESLCSWVSQVKNPPADAGDAGSIPGSGRSPGEGNGSPLQYSYLENPMDRGACWAAVHGVTKSRTQLSDFTSLRLVLNLLLVISVSSYVVFLNRNSQSVHGLF